MQCWVALWILDVFYTSSSSGIEVIVGLIPIYLHFIKLSRRAQLRMASLLSNHAIKSLLKNRHTSNIVQHHLLLENIAPRQQLKVKSSVVNSKNCLDSIFLSFNLLNNKLFLRNRLINIFANYISFHKI